MQELNSEKNIIQIQNVSFSYGNEEVLSGITLNIPQGDYLGWIGPNGAGKTTLLKIVLGLLTPNKGSIQLFGKDIHEFKDWAKIGYVPQQATHFDANFPVTVREVVLMGRYARRGLFHATTKEDAQLVKDALKKVNMWEYKDRLIGELSGGQQQRVFIARALATQPEIIFLDEPTIGIDPKTREEFYLLLKKLNKELNLTLILISHDVEVVVREAQHIACIDRALVCHGLPKEFLADSRSADFLPGGVKIIAHKHQH